MTAKDYDERLASLATGDGSRFMTGVRNLVQNDRIRIIPGVAKIASESEQAIEWLISLMLRQETNDSVHLVAFHSVRFVGPAAFPALRKAWEHEWERKRSLKRLGQIHMCMTDIAGAAGNSPETKRQMPPIAQQEIPRWIECLRADQSSVRFWAIWILACLLPFAPELAEEVRRGISDLTVDDDQQVRDRAIAAVRDIGRA